MEIDSRLMIWAQDRFGEPGNAVVDWLRRLMSAKTIFGKWIASSAGPLIHPQSKLYEFLSYTPFRPLNSH